RGRQYAMTRQQVAQTSAGHVLHREEQEPLALTDVVQPHHVRMTDAPRRRSLAPQSIGGRGIERRDATYHLERDLLAELLVAREIDRTHAALPERTLDHPAIRELLAGRELGAREVVGVGELERARARSPRQRRQRDRERDLPVRQPIELRVELEV